MVMIDDDDNGHGEVGNYNFVDEDYDYNELVDGSADYIDDGDDDDSEVDVVMLMIFILMMMFIMMMMIIMMII